MRKTLLYVGIALLIISYIFFFVNIFAMMVFGMISLVLTACGIIIPNKYDISSGNYEEYGLLLIILGLVQIPAGKVGIFHYEIYSFIWLYLGGVILTGIVLFYIYRLQRDMPGHDKHFKRFHLSFKIYAIGYIGAFILFALFFVLDEVVFDRISTVDFEGWTIGIIIALILLLGSTIFEVVYWFYFYRQLNKELNTRRSSTKSIVKSGIIILIIISIVSVFFIGLTGVSIFDFVFPFIDVDYSEKLVIILTCHVIGDALYLVGFILAGVSLMRSARN